MELEFSKKFYERIDEELFDKHSIAALVVLINIGFELEFHYKDIPYSITWLDKKIFLSSPQVEKGQKFENITDLIIHATIDGIRFIDVWDELVLDFI